MGIFEQFPYSNFHNANLDNVLNNSNQALRDAANAVHIAGEAKDIAEGLADDVATALQEAEAASTAAASAEATAAQAQAEAEAVSGLAQDAYDTASAAGSAAANALSVANTAISNANTALSTANTANTNASNAVTTANTANTNASAAVNTANTASTNASAAVSTANAALDAVNNIPDASTSEKGLVQFPVTIAQGGTGQTGQTAQQSYTPAVKIGSTAQTVASLNAYYKSWGLMKLIGGRFNLTTTGTGQLIISLPTGFTVPTSAVQPMGVLIAPNQKVYQIRVAADGLAAMNNGGSNVAWTTGFYCFWVIVMGN